MITRITHYVLLITIILFFGFSANADSIWKPGTSTSPYSPDKSFKVGDIITILIVESSTAQHKAGTNTDVKDNLGLQFSHTIDRLNSLIGPSNSVAGQANQKYGGQGSTNRASNVQAKIAAAVTEVLENGNLKIEGHHKVSVNDETQDIMVAGSVRSKDISINNTIYSYQVADADISIKGNGVVQEAEAPGWLTRIFNWLF
ncbi:MAG: flagellar basal body L-ring protein FlgH [Candidatus Margulisiibacteriota bacterium]